MEEYIAVVGISEYMLDVCKRAIDDGVEYKDDVIWSEDTKVVHDGYEFDVAVYVRSESDMNEFGKYDAYMELVVTDERGEEVALSDFSYAWDNEITAIADHLGVLFTLSIDEIKF